MMEDVPLLQSLVDQFGPEMIYEAGLKVLGYPPTWEPSLKEVLQIKQFLNS